MYDRLILSLFNWLPFTSTLFIGILIIYVFQKISEQRVKSSVSANKIYYQLTILVFIIFLLVTLILELPISEAVQGQLLSLVGITLTAAVALSSPTFLGNMMAALMLKVLNKYRIGDFLIIDSHFGRITELGLLHTEIQTLDRDLTTLPNHYLVTNPVKVIRSSGTILSEEVSLGYDIHHNKVEESLLRAARNAGLEGPFMHVQKLGDFSVTYKISGFLKDVKSILSCKAKLREEILDALHADKIEIVSPNFMNQRVFNPQSVFIPQYQKDSEKISDEYPEDLIFDKADQAESIEKLKEKIETIEIEAKQIKEDKDLAAEKRELRLNELEKRKIKIKEIIKRRSQSSESE